MWIVIGAQRLSSINTEGGASDFILAMFIDPVGVCMICSPVFLPIATSPGFDPTWSGILFILNCGMAYIIPPSGFNLIRPSGHRPCGLHHGGDLCLCLALGHLEAVVPMLVMFFPIIGMWLPDRMG